ncbi:hypothetical protein WG901_13100 [Novosphingobium sp. PS1R-30]|uniref:Tyr recombinase domain-containing protein n=1 Tax=Novosphingobium anseongense TaxID=3133436 RepID=A0ABU8RWW5_9SPHN
MSRFEGQMRAQRGLKALSIQATKAADAADDDLLFSIISKDELLVTIDLRPYRDGDATLGLCGSPGLIIEMLPYIKKNVIIKKRSRKAIGLWIGKVVKEFFFFLSKIEIETARKIRSFSEMCEYDGILLKRYLMERGGDQSSRKKIYTKIYSMIREVRPNSAKKLIWPSYIVSQSARVHTDIDPRAIREVYHTCKRIIEAHDVSQDRIMGWVTGAVPETDVRCRLGRSVWEHLYNKILQPELIDRAKRSAENQKFQKLKDEIGLRDYSELTYCFAPSAIEVTASILIVSMETGWIDAIHGIDLEADWYANRSTQSSVLTRSTDTVVIYATRPKTGGEVVGIGMAGSRYRSFQLIKRLEEKSQFLRLCLKIKLDDLALLPESEKIKAEILEIKHKLRSPWIYYAHQLGVGSNCVGISSAPKLDQVMARILEKTVDNLAPRKRQDQKLVSSIRSLTWSDMRDAFAEHIYQSSGGNIYVLRNALNHKNIQVSKAYINQRKQIKARFDAFRCVVESALGELKNHRPIDPTILFLTANGGIISQEDRDRLKRFRSRMGMGCSDPRQPDAHLAQGHKKGAICTVQRCILCSKGVIFSESFRYIAKRYGDLLWLRENISPQRWLTSSFWWEINAVELVRDKIFRHRSSEFDKVAKERLYHVKAGEEFVFDDPGCGGVVHWDEQ